MSPVLSSRSTLGTTSASLPGSPSVAPNKAANCSATAARCAASADSNAARDAKPIASRERLALGGFFRQRLRLLVVAILQAVLEPAQEKVRGMEPAGRRFGQQTPARDCRQRRQRAAHAQRRLAAAAHQLQRLHDELDLADAAGAELDVGRIVAALALLADLAMDVAQAVVGVEVEVLAKYEGRDEARELVVPAFPSARGP